MKTLELLKTEMDAAKKAYMEDYSSSKKAIELVIFRKQYEMELKKQTAN
jgi:hypothetical protein